MKSPWEDIDAAFEPMYDESVAVTHGLSRTTLRAAVFDDGTDDPAAADAMDTEREAIRVVCRRRDWPYVQTLQRGDALERADGRRYRIVEARRDANMGFVIRARGV